MSGPAPPARVAIRGGRRCSKPADFMQAAKGQEFGWASVSGGDVHISCGFGWSSGWGRVELVGDRDCLVRLVAFRHGFAHSHAHVEQGGLDCWGQVLGG